MDLTKEIIKSINQGCSVRFTESYANYCRVEVYKDGYHEAREYMPDICLVDEMPIVVKALTNNVLKKISGAELTKGREETHDKCI